MPGNGACPERLLTDVPLRKGFKMNSLSCLNPLRTLTEAVTVVKTLISGKFKKPPSENHGMAIVGYSYFTLFISENIHWTLAVCKAAW